MATLTVTNTKDFRGDNLSNITDIVYQANAVATFSASQFDGAQISTSVHLDAGVHNVLTRIFMDDDHSISAANWTFANFGANDIVRFVGTADVDSIHGSRHHDEIFGQGGGDILFGDAGNDAFVYTGTVNPVPADIINGGTGIDTLVLRSPGETPFNFTLSQLTNVEIVDLVTAGSQVIVKGDQIGTTGKIAQVRFLAEDTSLIVNGAAVDLFTVSMAGADPRITINGLASTANRLVGSNTDDTINGGSKNDILDGALGDDTLNGGAGIDTASYSHARAGVTVGLGPGVNATGGAGFDTLIGIENLTGSVFADRLVGNDARNQLDGGNDRDMLVGGLGFDTLIGGSDNDLYVLADVSFATPFASKSRVFDRVVENEFGGTDKVLVQRAGNVGAYQLGANVENGAIVGGSVFTLRGNDLLNVLDGNIAANSLFGHGNNDTLIGRAGADLLDGGAGDDTLIVEDAGDQITELAGQGSDTVIASVSYALGAGDAVEEFRTSDVNATTAINLIGNELAQRINGNAGSNILIGGGGIDILDGRGGNNSYNVDSTTDVVVEAAGQGTDNVNTSVSYTLDAGIAVETLRTTAATGADAINLTGNEIANFVTGNAGSNSIDGKAGNDTLTGIGGNDFFVFSTALNAATNVDTIVDFVVANDTVRLENSIFAGLAIGTVSADAFHIGRAAADAEDRIIYDNATGALLFDSNGSAAGGAIRFAQLTTGLALTNADFVVI